MALSFSLISSSNSSTSCSNFSFSSWNSSLMPSTYSFHSSLLIGSLNGTVLKEQRILVSSTDTKRTHGTVCLKRSSLKMPTFLWGKSKAFILSTMPSTTSLGNSLSDMVVSNGLNIPSTKSATYCAIFIARPRIQLHWLMITIQE